MARLTLNERWVGALAAADSEAICGQPLRLALRLTLHGWRALRSEGWPIEAEITGLTAGAGVTPGTDTLPGRGRLSLRAGALRYALETQDGVVITGTRSLSLRGFPPPLTILRATLRRGTEPLGRSTLRFDVRTELRRMLPRNEAHRL